MNKDIFDKCVKTERLHFEGQWQLFTYFWPVGYMGLLPVGLLTLHAIDLIRVVETSFKKGEIWLIIVPLLLMFLTYLWQRNILRFYSVHTALNRKQLKEVILNVSQELKWITMSSSKDVYTAKTFPGFFSGSWGEHITVLFHENIVFINSICDPDKTSSIVSFGRNRNNVQTLIKRIEEADLAEADHQ